MGNRSFFLVLFLPSCPRSLPSRPDQTVRARFLRRCRLDGGNGRSHLDWFAMQCDDGPRAGQVVLSLLRTIRSSNYSYVRIVRRSHRQPRHRPRQGGSSPSKHAKVQKWLGMAPSLAHSRRMPTGRCARARVLVAARRCDSRDCRGPVLPRGSLVTPLIHAVAVFGTTRLVADLRLLLRTRQPCDQPSLRRGV